jgi:hypothetical protein
VVVAFLTTKVEYMATTHEIREAVWLDRLCLGIGFEQQAMHINCDTQSEFFLSKNPTYHSRTKHIDLQYHFMRDMVERKKVLLEKVDTLKKIVDSLNKFVTIVKFCWYREEMGIVSLGQ